MFIKKFGDDIYVKHDVSIDKDQIFKVVEYNGEKI